MKVHKAVLTVCFVLFVLLLLWPLVVGLSYMLFSGVMKYVFIFALFALELGIGAFLLRWLITNRNNLKKWVFWVVTPLIGVCYLVYISTLIFVYIIN